MTDGPITDLGVIVNDREGMDKSNDRTQAYGIEEAVVPLRMPHSIFDRFLKAAEFSGMSLEAYIMAKMVSSLETKVGETTISSPSQVSGQMANKITGPSNLGMVRRG